jgi:glycosyltransferase involved in cell wall biosynthesis
MPASGAVGLVGVIPALDASATIGSVVAGALRHLTRVIVVDDGSSDDTAARAAAAGAEVLRHPANRGKGAALDTAFRLLIGEHRAALARGPGVATGLEGVVTLDADGQHEPDDIPRFVDRFRRERPAIIVGSRAAYFESMRGPRRAMNRFSSAALRFFAGADLPDSQSGFRLYDARFLERLDLDRPALRGARYEAEMEALMRAAGLGLPLASVPIRMRVVDGVATSHYRFWSDTFRIIGVVLGLWFRRITARQS